MLITFTGGTLLKLTPTLSLQISFLKSMIPESFSFLNFLFEMAKQWIQVPPGEGQSRGLQSPHGLAAPAPTSRGPELLIPYCGG